MGVRTVAIAEHQLSASALDKARVECDHLMTDLGIEGSWEWALDQECSSPINQLDYYGYATMYLPREFSLDINSRTLAIGHVTQWQVFLTDSDCQEHLRRKFRRFHPIFKCGRMVYVPDTQFCPSLAAELVRGRNALSLSEIEDSLRKECGLPAKSLSSIYQLQSDGCWTGNGYYVDDFADLVEE